MMRKILVTHHTHTDIAYTRTAGREGAALTVKNEGVTLTVPARDVNGLRLTS